MALFTIKAMHPFKILTLTLKVTLVFLAGYLTSSAQTTFTAATGNWSTPANWSNGVPTSGVTAIIQAGSTCSLDVASASCSSLTISGGTANSSFIVSSNNSLTVTNAITISAPSSNSVTNTLLVGAGSVSCSSISMANPAGNGRVCSISISTGTLSCSGNCTLNGAASENSITLTSSGVFQVGGTLSGNTGSFSFTSGTVNYNGGGNQTILGLTYYHLSTSTGGTKTLGGTTTVNGNLTIGNGSTINFASRSITIEGTFTNNGTVSETSTGGTNIIKGLFTNYGSWSVAVAETYEFRGGILNYGSFAPSNGIFTFSTNNQSIDGTNPVSFPSTVNIIGSITLTNKVTLVVNGDLIGSVSGSTFLNNGGVTVAFGGAVLSTGTLDASANNNTVNYNRAGSQTLKTATYHHLQKSNSGTLTSGGPVSVNGNLTVNTGALDQSTFNVDVNGDVTGNGAITMSSGTFTIGGNNTNSGTFTRGTGTVIYDGTNQTVAAWSYNNLTLSGSGTKTMGGAVTINAALSLSSGNLLSLSGNTLTLNGSITGTGSINGSSSSSISIAGSGTFGTLSMDQTSSATRTLNNLTVNRSGVTITLGSALDIVGVVTVSAGTLASGGNLTITSTASGDARIAQSAGSITGNVIVQKYIPAGSSRRWIHMGSPIQSFTWNQVIDDILISGPGAGGFDVNGSNYPSAYTYTESVAGDCGPNGWNYPTNVANSTTAGHGLKLFFRGDRNLARLNYNGPAPNAVTVDFVGAVNSGTQNMGVTYTNNGNSTWDGWNFVSNPYPSAIDWNAASGWTKTNISGTVYVWNAQSGTYATWNGASGTNGMSNGRIAMGQGFWVKATAASPSLVMTESVKTGTAATGFFKTNQEVPQTLRISMIQDSLIWDDAVFNFNNNYTGDFVKESGDALKLYNTSLNLWSVTKDNHDLVINNLSLPALADTIPLGMNSSQGGIFTLSFSTDSLPSNLSVFLIDNYRNKTIDIRKEKTWKVLINVEPESYATGRLKLVLINQDATVITAGANVNQATKSIDVNWSSTNEINTVRYEVEHSTNRVNFTAIATVDLNDTLILSASNYLITDVHAQFGMNYYRIKRTSTTGNVTYSDIVSGELIETNNTGINQILSKTLQVYPMPTSTEASIFMPEQLSGDIKLELVSVSGRVVVLSSTNTKVMGGTSIAFNVSNLAAGYYIVRISSAKTVVTGKLIKQ